MCKSLIFKILFLLLFIKSTGQEKVTKKLGTGFLYVNTENVLPLYKNPKDKTPIDILKFEKDDFGIKKLITNFNLKPYIIFEGDTYEIAKSRLYKHFPILVFRVLDTSKQYFKVVLNEVSLEEAYLKREKENVYYTKNKDFISCSSLNYNPKWFLFETWERILLDAVSIVSDNLLIYDKPGGKVIYKQVEKGKYFPFIAVKFKGEWIKVVKLPGREFFFDKNTNYDGWIKWKENETLVISFTSLSSLYTENKE